MNRRFANGISSLDKNVLSGAWHYCRPVNFIFHTNRLACVSAQPEIRPSSADWADWDGDGDIDLAIGFNGQANRVYQNNDGKFSLDLGSTPGKKTHRAFPGMIGTMMVTRIWQWVTLGSLIKSTKIREAPSRLVWESPDAMNTQSVAWADWNNDELPDLAIGNEGQVNQIYQSTGGSFELVWESTGDEKNTYSVAWADWDSDGDPDLGVGNVGQVNQIYQNDGGALSLAWESGDEQNTRSISWADADRDGDTDLAVGNFGQPNQVFEE